MRPQPTARTGPGAPRRSRASASAWAFRLRTAGPNGRHSELRDASCRGPLGWRRARQSVRPQRAAGWRSFRELIGARSCDRSLSVAAFARRSWSWRNGSCCDGSMLVVGIRTPHADMVCCGGTCGTDGAHGDAGQRMTHVAWVFDADRHNQMTRSLHLAALAAPRPPCSSPRPRPTPRAFPAPAGCSRGPKRLPRPSTSHAWQICSRSNRMLLVLLVIQQARRSRSSSSSSRRSLYCTRCRRSGQVARYLLELVQSSAVRQAASRPLSTCFRMAVPHTLD